MGKFTALFLATALALSASNAMAKRVDAPKVVRDATWRASGSVMTSDLTRAQSTIPLGTIVAWPHNDSFPGSVADDWAECDGRALPANCDLRKQFGITHTPNLYDNGGHFLRPNVIAGIFTTDSVGSHRHEIKPHTHEFEGKLVSTAIAGQADGQEFSYGKTWFDQSGNVSGSKTLPTGNSGSTKSSGSHTHVLDPYKVVSYSGEGVWSVTGVTNSGGAHTHELTWGAFNELTLAEERGVAEKSDVEGHVINDKVEGITEEGGPGYTEYAGSGETAPKSYTARYFMRINE